MEQTNNYEASCVLGAERVLSQELEHIGLKETKRQAGRLSFETDNNGLANALVNLRTADRIFLELANFHAEDFDALYEGIKNIEWERFIGKDDKLIIDKVRSMHSKLSSQTAIQSVSHKAAYERLCKKYKTARMPESNNLVSVRIKIENDNVKVELDMCGQALSKRGYRKHPTEAPLKESVAASVLYLSGWRRSFALYDTFCGSGTLAIEAALMAFDIAPGLNRTFSWEYMPDNGKTFIKEIKNRAKEAIKLDRDILISASDIDPSSITAAKLNAKLAGVENRIRFFNADAAEAAPFADKGFVITDPPYGKRLGTKAEAEKLYASLDGFASRFEKWNLCFVVDKEDFGPELKASGKWKKTKLVDGAEIRFLQRLIH